MEIKEIIQMVLSFLAGATIGFTVKSYKVNQKNIKTGGDVVGRDKK